MIQKSKKFKKASSDQGIFFSILIGILVLLGIGFLIFSNFKISQRRAELTSRIEALKKEIQILEEKNQQLQTKISQVKTKDYLEKVAREQFGLQYPGEEVVVITNEKEEKKEIKEGKNLLNSQNWWQWLKNKFAAVVQW